MGKDSEKETEKKKGGKGFLIVLLLLFLIAAGFLIWYLYFREDGSDATGGTNDSSGGTNTGAPNTGAANTEAPDTEAPKEPTPEEIAMQDLDSAYGKNWKSIIDRMTDETFEMLFLVEDEQVKKKSIKNAKELRDWAVGHVLDVRDPMNGKKIKDYKVEKVTTMTPEEYIKAYLGEEETVNKYYEFLMSKEEIAVVQITYTQLDGDKETERHDYVVEYKQDGKWYSLTGVQVIDGMLKEIE